MSLPTNFVDDVLSTDMDGKRRFNMITNEDDTISFEDATEYLVHGSSFGAAQMNDTNAAVNENTEALGGVKFGVVSGSYGYYNADDEFVAFKSQADIDAAVAAARVGDATAANVLAGKTFTNSSASGIPGTMPNRGAWTSTKTATTSNQTVTIPSGYHNGSGSVTVKPQVQSGTYTFPSGSTGSTHDLTATNNIRYVNAESVYLKGKADAAVSYRTASTGNIGFGESTKDVTLTTTPPSGATFCTCCIESCSTWNWGDSNTGGSCSIVSSSATSCTVRFTNNSAGAVGINWKATVKWIYSGS